MSVLKILNTDEDFLAPGNVNLSIHRMDEAIRFGYGQAWKRPLSSIIPVLVTHPDGRLFFITGAAGGSRIATTTIQNINHTADEGLSAADALACPRLHDQLVPDQVLFEYASDNFTVAYMKQRGHNLTSVAPGLPDWSEAQAIRVLPNGTFEAAGEPRQSDHRGFSV
ncbi:hypothetical protein N7475_006916 [Penicillium sp. IBT 31633x]|nr:hypothetical protein N7475_006916 [Penicillium sp. IBT 31633x]